MPNSQPCVHWSQETGTFASGDLSQGWGARREGFDKHLKERCSLARLEENLSFSLAHQFVGL